MCRWAPGVPQSARMWGPGEPLAQRVWREPGRRGWEERWGQEAGRGTWERRRRRGAGGAAGTSTHPSPVGLGACRPERPMKSTRAWTPRSWLIQWRGRVLRGGENRPTLSLRSRREVPRLLNKDLEWGLRWVPEREIGSPPSRSRYCLSSNLTVRVDD